MGVQFTFVRGQNDRVSISANELLKREANHPPPPHPVLYKNRMRYRIIVFFIWIRRKFQTIHLKK